MKTLIAAFGSFAESDNIAWKIAAELEKQLDCHATDTTVFCPGSPIELLNHLNEVDQLVVLDSCLSDSTPGSIQVVDLQSILEQPSLKAYTSSHGFDVLATIRLAAELGRLPALTSVWGIESSLDCVDHQSLLTPGLLRQIKDMLEEKIRSTNDIFVPG